MDFNLWVSELLAQVPEGSVTTYGDLARALGDVKAARAVALALETTGEDVPAHRVVARDGSVRTGAEDILATEGVGVTDGRVDVERHNFSVFAGGRPLEQLRARQSELAARVSLERSPDVRTVGGADVGYNDREATGAVCVFDAKTGELLAEATAKVVPGLPYVPTYLGFRELEPVRAALDNLEERPDVLMVDGHGILHPRGLGTACHVGVVLDQPTIGVGKSHLCGRVEGRPPEAEVWLDGEVKGYALWANARVKNPVYVSPGHRMDRESSLALAKRFLKHRVPEPVRRAHALAGERGKCKVAKP